MRPKPQQPYGEALWKFEAQVQAFFSSAEAHVDFEKQAQFTELFQRMVATQRTAAIPPQEAIVPIPAEKSAASNAGRVPVAIEADVPGGVNGDAASANAAKVGIVKAPAPA